MILRIPRAALQKRMPKDDKFDLDRLRYKRPRGRPPVENPMRQITIRLPDDLLEAIDVVLDEREGASDRSTVIREAVIKGLREMR